ncbi:MAG TPA: hypothetical protein VLB84_18965, partial [Bacteroidia bacterium]|nr:hypothetical protein [Bacteroidia bacterium]
MAKIHQIEHPKYTNSIKNWTKWRYVYEGGDDFISKYLEKFSRRETKDDFERRKKITYSPSFAKSAIQEIKNSIFTRLTDVNRQGGSESYHNAMKGLMGGVDLEGRSMTTFIGDCILPELLPIGKVGVFVDMPSVSGITVAENQNKRPYLYIYPAEEIRSWNSYINDKGQTEFITLLLRDTVITYDSETGLPESTVERYRYLALVDGRVQVKFYNHEGVQIDVNGIESNETIFLNISRIPFALVDLEASLLEDTANYQISLL